MDFPAAAQPESLRIPVRDIFQAKRRTKKRKSDCVLLGPNFIKNSIVRPGRLSTPCPPRATRLFLCYITLRRLIELYYLTSQTGYLSYEFLDCQLMHDTLADTSGIDSQCDMISEEMDIITLRTEQLMKENATVAMDQVEYNRKYDGYAARFEEAKQKMAELQALRTARIFEADAIECFMGTLLREPELPLEYSPELWNSLVDHVTVYRDERLVFTFRNGQEITEIL